MKRHNEANRENTENEGKPTRLDRELFANPLTVLRGYIQLLQRRIRAGREINDEELLRTLDILDDASQRLISIFDQAATTPPPEGTDKHPEV